MKLGCWGFKRDTSTACLDSCHQRLDGTTVASSRWVYVWSVLLWIWSTILWFWNFQLVSCWQELED